MVAPASFMVFGLLGGFAYLAYMKDRELLAYGLGGLGVSFFLEGFQAILGPDAPEGFTTFLDILRFTALGVGAAFLAYVGGTEGWRYFQAWRAKREAREAAFRLKMEANKSESAGHARSSAGR